MSGGTAYQAPPPLADAAAAIETAVAPSAPPIPDT
jgi:hypothetical protein